MRREVRVVGLERGGGVPQPLEQQLALLRLARGAARAPRDLVRVRVRARVRVRVRLGVGLGLVPPATCASSLQIRARRHWISAPPTPSCVSSRACASSKRCSAYLWSALCSACSAGAVRGAVRGSWVVGRGVWELEP